MLLLLNIAVHNTFVASDFGMRFMCWVVLLTVIVLVFLRLFLIRFAN